MNVPQELVQRQMELEAEYLGMGVTRYRGDKPLPWQTEPHRKEETELAPGKKLLNDAIGPLTEAIGAFVEAAGSGAARRRATALPYLAHVDPVQAAYLTARVAINAASTCKTVNTTAVFLGVALEEHLNMLRLAKAAPGLYRKVAEQLKTSTSSKHREGVYRHVRAKYHIESLRWSHREKLLVGMKLLELFVDATGFATLERRTTGKNDTPVFIVLTEQTQAWLERAHSKCELLAPLHFPMVAPPREWTNPYRGGYLSDLIHVRFVRTGSRGYLDELGSLDLSRMYKAVNAVQATPWRINRAVYEIMADLWNTGGAVAGMPRRSDLPLPPRPEGVPEKANGLVLTVGQQEALKTWKAKASKVHAENAATRGARIALTQQLYIGRRFLDERAIYFPHFVDFRGRIYPFASFVNPQADDTGKALLEFAEGKPLGEDGAFWLAVHIAGLWGIDKVSFDDRVKWVMENEEKILACVIDPHADDAFWHEADKPFQALAAAIEWAGYKMHGDEYVSHLPIAMDGSCSGLQHFSAMLRDEVGGAAVNLVPADKPADIYTAVAARAQAMSDSSAYGMAAVWEGKVCRKIAKQPTMTLCYSATKFGMQGQIENALRKLDEDGPYLDPAVERHHAAVYMAGIVWDAIGDVVIAAKRAMSWLQEVSKVAAEAGMPVRWTAPCGLPVLQEYKERVGKKIEVHFGGQRVMLTVAEDTNKLSVRRQVSGIAPNFVHSLDSSHLIGTVNLGLDNGLEHFCVIHDSFATHACDTSMLNAVLREAFVQQYRVDVLGKFREEIIEQLTITAPELVTRIPPCPRAGRLDLEAVRESEFFFA